MTPFSHMHFMFEKKANYRQKQDAVGDGKLRPRCRHLTISTKQRCTTSDWCRHLAKWTKHTRCFDFGLFPPSYGTMTLSAKPKVHNISHSRSRRTEPRSWVTCTENLVKCGRVIFETCVSGQTKKQTSKQINRHTDTLTTILRTRTGVEVVHAAQYSNN